MFLKQLKNTLWVVDKNTEEKLRTSTNPKSREDWLYLESVRGQKREGTLGPMDTQDLKKKKRKRVRNEQKKNRAISKTNTDDHLLSTSSDEEIDIHDPDIDYKANTNTPKQTKITKKNQVITPEVAAVAEKYSFSNRGMFEMVAATTSNINPNDKILSVNSVRRKRKLFSVGAADKIYSDEISAPSDYYTIHWDSKIFKALTHCGKNQERVAVLLTTADGKEILLGIIPVINGTAAEEHNRILALLVKKGIPLNKIAACVFDTTSVNTGEINGIVRRLEASFNHAILELACRHHIYELVCGAASELVLGKSQQGKDKKKTTAPYEPIFKNLCDYWEDIDKEKLDIF